MYFFSKIIFTMLFWVVIARWSYAEIARFSPAMREGVDRLMEVATIPTHDQWDVEAIRQFAQEIAENFKTEEAFAGDQ